MNFSKVPLFFILKIFILLFLLLGSVFLLIGKQNRHNLSSYFSTRCLDYKQKDFSRKLNDRLVDYIDEAKRGGIKLCRDEAELKKRISDGKLVKVKSGNKYVVDKLTHSYPYVTKRTKILIDEIGKRFMEKTSRKGLISSRFIITSMTRKSDSLKKLTKNNSNASVNSPHLYGNAFDITYKRFEVVKWKLTNCDDKYLKEALAEVIWQLRAEKKCWATYERGQNCFHVVAR